MPGDRCTDHAVSVLPQYPDLCSMVPSSVGRSVTGVRGVGGGWALVRQQGGLLRICGLFSDRFGGVFVVPGRRLRAVGMAALLRQGPSSWCWCGVLAVWTARQLTEEASMVGIGVKVSPFPDLGVVFTAIGLRHLVVVLLGDEGVVSGRWVVGGRIPDESFARRCRCR